MKKILTLVVALIITTGLVNAQDQTKTPAKATTTPAATKCDMKNCCMMKSGKMICMKDGKEVAMNEDVKLKNGSIVHVDGSMDTKDGKKVMLKEGQCIDMNGTMGRMQQPRAASSSDKVAEPSMAQPALEPAK